MSAGGWHKLLATGWINIIDYISKKPWKFDVTVTLKLAIKNFLSGKIEFELSSVIQKDCPPWVGIFQSLQLLIFVKWIYLLQYSSLDILILGRENNDLLLKELQEEKPLSKIKGDPENFHMGPNNLDPCETQLLWENMENILHQIASQLVCTHSPYLQASTYHPLLSSNMWPYWYKNFSVIRMGWGGILREFLY